MKRDKKDILLSVIVPIYNAAPYLRKCLDSIIHQTYQNLEIILVADGGSIDSSKEICEEYAKKDARVKVLHRPHESLPAGRKAGVMAATGKYVAYVDSDDWLELGAYENLVMSMGEQSPDMLLYGFIREYEDKGVVCQYGLPIGYYDARGIAQEIYPRLLEFHFPYQWEMRPGYWETNGQDRIKRGPNPQMRQMNIYSGVWSKLVKRNILMHSQMLVPDDLTEGEDLVCSVYSLFMAHSLMVTDLFPYHYRFRVNSLARTDKPYKQYQLLFHSLHKALLYQPLTDVYLMRLLCFMIDYALLNCYDRFLAEPFSDVLFGNIDGARVALYGAGKFGKEIYRKTAAVFPDRIVLWVDRNYEAAQKEHLPVEPIETLRNREYDVVIVALVDEEICKEIKQDLTAMGIAPGKIRYVTASPEVLKAVETIFSEEPYLDAVSGSADRCRREGGD